MHEDSDDDDDVVEKKKVPGALGGDSRGRDVAWHHASFFAMWLRRPLLVAGWWNGPDDLHLHQKTPLRIIGCTHTNLLSRWWWRPSYECFKVQIKLIRIKLKVLLLKSPVCAKF